MQDKRVKMKKKENGKVPLHEVLKEASLHKRDTVHKISAASEKEWSLEMTSLQPFSHSSTTNFIPKIF